MRDRDEIEHEIEDRSRDLAENVQELGEIARNKVPMNARAAMGKAKERVKDAATRVRTAARERPELFIAIGGALVAGIFALKVRGAIRRRRALEEEDYWRPARRHRRAPARRRYRRA